jgi:Uma2 family endonuclease
MSSLAHSLVTWTEFLRLPERPEGGQRYELHDGEVVTVPPARPIHIKLQKRIEGLLEALAGDRGVVTIEFPYRPVANLQYWFADVAYIPRVEYAREDGASARHRDLSGDAGILDGRCREADRARHELELDENLPSR